MLSLGNYETKNKLVVTSKQYTLQKLFLLRVNCDIFTTIQLQTKNFMSLFIKTLYVAMLEYQSVVITTHTLIHEICCFGIFWRILIVPLNNNDQVYSSTQNN